MSGACRVVALCVKLMGTAPDINCIKQRLKDKDLSAIKVELKWSKLAQSRQAWRQLIATVRT